VARATLRLIHRGELLAALDRAVTKKVTIISAPAGSGKTSLLRSWVGGPGQRHRLAVLQVERGQHDAQQFWLAVLGAVRDATGPGRGAVCDATGPGRGAAPPAATPEFNGQAMADRVRSELAGARGGITLVIDDLHELRSPDAAAQLAGLLTRLPPDTHAIVATRRDLRLRLHQLRLAGDLAEIRAAELRFTEPEAGELLAVSGITLSEADVARLHQRTEGWAAGLRLAALALAGHGDPERFVAEFSGRERTVSEYLIAEMLDRQPGEVQDLLLRTSLLDRVNGELADLLTGRPGSERVLLDLEDANAFVVSLDPERTWFRYHHLFGDLLRLELRRRMPGQVAALHLGAAAWFAGQGQVTDAVRHTQAARDWPGAARLLADHCFSLTLDGPAQTIEALVRAFPPGTEQAELALARATGDFIAGRLDEAAAHLTAAEAHAQTVPPDRQHRLRAAIAALKVSLARRRGHLTSVLEQARFLGSAVTGRSGEGIALDRDLRAVTLLNLGTVEAWSLGIGDAEGHLREGAALARKIGRPYLEVGCLAQLGFAAKIHPIATTQARCREAIALAEQYGWGSEGVIAPALLTLAAAVIWTGDLDQGERWLQRAARAMQADTGPDIRLLMHIVSGMLQAGRGHLHEALEEFNETERLRRQMAGSHALASKVTAWTLATQARLGRPDQARAALAALDDERAGSGEIANAAAAIALAEGDPAAALGALRGVLDGRAPVFSDLTVIETQLLAGRAHRELGDQRAANQAAERALALAEPDRPVLAFLLTGGRDLLETLPRRQTAHAVLRTDILDIMSAAAPVASGPPGPPAGAGLSPGELRVLRYLPTNLSRSEIASELAVSVNTVNSQVRSVYVKLRVRGRSSAVQRARELRLLADRAIAGDAGRKLSARGRRNVAHPGRVSSASLRARWSFSRSSPRLRSTASSSLTRARRQYRVVRWMCSRVAARWTPPPQSR
jgi:LuxR family maltose regulon positive regulatory protein